MCGIAGVVGSFIPGLAQRMNQAQAHRGPDGRGVFEDAEARIALGHVRLAILDLSERAAQPMHSPDGRFVLICNGEIYNYRELRQELAAEGCSFRSTGDTEVLLRGLERRGEAFLERLNGMFAFALWDCRERELLLARDPIGIKPLYLCEPGPGELAFASEIKALCAHPGVRREPDFDALLGHMTLGYLTGASTAFKGIRRLPPGHVLLWHDGRISMRRYWTPRYGDSRETRAEATAALRDQLARAARRQTVSDVPVGSFLSGGLDSSVVTTLAASGPCFTITYPQNQLDGPNDDPVHARSLATKLGLPFHELAISPDVVSLLPKVIHHLDEPIVDSATITAFLISREARRLGTVVLLSGQGGDELFAGYPRYTAMGLTNWADHLPRALRRIVSGAAELVPSAYQGPLGATLRRARRVLTVIDQDPDDRFVALMLPTARKDALRVLGRPRSPAAPLDGKGLRGVDRWLDRDLSAYLPNNNLLYTDKMGMAVGVEARVPLLDQELVDTVTRYPAEWKLEGARTKAIFRDAARGIVPDPIIDRPKAGFGAPYRFWLRHNLGEMWNDLTSETVVRRRGWFDPAALREIRRRSQSGRQDLYMLQWAVLTIELWARQFIDRNPGEGG